MENGLRMFDLTVKHTEPGEPYAPNSVGHNMTACTEGRALRVSWEAGSTEVPMPFAPSSVLVTSSTARSPSSVLVTSAVQ